MANKKKKKKEPAKKLHPEASPWCCHLLKPLILVENPTEKLFDTLKGVFFGLFWFALKKEIWKKAPDFQQITISGTWKGNKTQKKSICRLLLQFILMFQVWCLSVRGEKNHL